VTSPDPIFGNGNDNVPNALREEPLLDMTRKIQNHFEDKTSTPFDAALMLVYDDAFLNFSDKVLVLGGVGKLDIPVDLYFTP